MGVALSFVSDSRTGRAGRQVAPLYSERGRRRLFSPSYAAGVQTICSDVTARFSAGINSVAKSSRLRNQLSLWSQS